MAIRLYIFVKSYVHKNYAITSQEQKTFTLAAIEHCPFQTNSYF